MSTPPSLSNIQLLQPSNPTLGLQSKPVDAGSGSMSAYATQPGLVVSDQYSHLPNLQRAIVRFIAGQPPRDEGVHVAIIAKAIGGGDVDARKIRYGHDFT